MPEVRGCRPRFHGNEVAPSPHVCSSWGPYFKRGLTNWWVPKAARAGAMARMCPRLSCAVRALSLHCR